MTKKTFFQMETHDVLSNITKENRIFLEIIYHFLITDIFSKATFIVVVSQKIKHLIEK